MVFGLEQENWKVDFGIVENFTVLDKRPAYLYREPEVKHVS